MVPRDPRHPSTRHVTADDSIAASLFAEEGAVWTDLFEVADRNVRLAGSTTASATTRGRVLARASMPSSPRVHGFEPARTGGAIARKVGRPTGTGARIARNVTQL